MAARALGWLLVAKALHVTRPTPSLLRRLRRPRPAGPRAAVDPAELGWALAAVSKRLPWRSDCLIQALAGKLWMDRLRLPADLRLGVQADAAGELHAHAWLEVDGLAVTGGRPDPALSPFLPAGAAARVAPPAAGRDPGPRGAGDART